MPRNAPAPDHLSVVHAFLDPSAEPNFSYMYIILVNDTYQVWKVADSERLREIQYFHGDIVEALRHDDDAHLERASSLSAPWAMDSPKLAEEIERTGFLLPAFVPAGIEQERIDNAMTRLEDLEAATTTAQHNMVENHIEGTPVVDPNGPARNLSGSIRDISVNDVPSVTDTIDPTPGHTHTPHRMQAYLRVTNIDNHTENNIVTTTVTSVDDEGRQFIVDFTHLPATAIGCTAGEVRLLLNSDGTLQATFGPYHIRSNNRYDPVIRYFEAVRSSRDAQGHLRQPGPPTEEQRQRRLAEAKAKEESRKKEKIVLQRIKDANPDMSCVCCNGKIHEPQNIVKLLGAEESERYLEFCKKNGQLPELYCCSCYELVEREPRLLSQYKMMFDQYKYFSAERCRLAESEKRLEEEQQKVRLQKIKLVNDEIELRKTLELEKDSYARTFIRTLGINPKTLIKNYHTEKSPDELVHCNRCLISDIPTMMKCSGTKDPTEDCKNWTESK